MYSTAVAQAPGTVSKILWHFTGGPRWNSEKNCQQRKPKSAADAYEALLSILRTGELKLGDYREVVRVQIPKLRQWDKRTGESRVLKSVMREMQSSQVCCLSDIPIAHLSYQAKRYGKMAIGFHRDAVVRHGFNPVFYTLYDTQVLRSIRRGFRGLRHVDVYSIQSAAWDIESKTQSAECEHGHEVDLDIGNAIFDIESGAKDVAAAVSSAQGNLEEFLAFVKTFGPSEFSTIYCEREWRSTEPFSFSKSDVAMVVLPKASAKGSYFRNFVKRAKTLGLPRSIPVVPWEDLIEH